MSCTGCSLKYDEVVLMEVDPSRLKYHLMHHLIIPSTLACRTCDAIMTVDDNYFFRCSSRKRQRGGEKRCQVKVSSRAGTWIAGTHLPPLTVLKLCYVWLAGWMTIRAMAEQYGIAKSTVIDWASYCREVCIHWAEFATTKLGGVGKMVEIDEAKFGKKRNKPGQRAKSTWVVGGFERTSGRCFFVPTDRRDSASVIAIIKEHVSPGTTIISDCWRGYVDLKKHGYTHSVVNSSNFVNPEDGSHTQNIKRAWRDVKSTIPSTANNKLHFAGYLAKHLFVRAHPDMGQRFCQFLLHAASMYPGRPSS